MRGNDHVRQQDPHKSLEVPGFQQEPNKLEVKGSFSAIFPLSFQMT